MKIKVLTGNERTIGQHEPLLIAVQVTDDASGTEHALQGKAVMFKSEDADAFADRDTGKPYRQKKTDSRGVAEVVFQPQKTGTDAFGVTVSILGPTPPVEETVEVTVVDKGLAAAHHGPGGTVVRTSSGTVVVAPRVAAAPAPAPERIVIIGADGSVSTI